MGAGLWRQLEVSVRSVRLCEVRTGGAVPGNRRPGQWSPESGPKEGVRAPLVPQLLRPGTPVWPW